MSHPDLYTVYSLSWPSGRVYIGMTGGSLKQRLNSHRKRPCRREMADEFDSAGDPEIRVIAGGLSRDEAAVREAGLIRDVRLVIGERLLND